MTSVQGERVRVLGHGGPGRKQNERKEKKKEINLASSVFPSYDDVTLAVSLSLSLSLSFKRHEILGVV